MSIDCIQDSYSLIESFSFTPVQNKGN